jgi:hypothetical protein
MSAATAIFVNGERVPDELLAEDRHRWVKVPVARDI